MGLDGDGWGWDWGNAGRWETRLSWIPSHSHSRSHHHFGHRALSCSWIGNRWLIKRVGVVFFLYSDLALIMGTLFLVLLGILCMQGLDAFFVATGHRMHRLHLSSSLSNSISVAKEQLKASLQKQMEGSSTLSHLKPFLTEFVDDYAE